MSALLSLSRAALLGAGSAVALVGLPLMTTFVEAAARADSDDLETLNSAIQLEAAGIKAYADAAGTGLLEAPILAVATRFMNDHIAHREALVAAVTAGGGVPTKLVASIPYPPLHSQRDILAFALGIERKAASTYLSVIEDIKDRRFAMMAASILGVETTHVSALATALGQPVYPSAFVV